MYVFLLSENDLILGSIKDLLSVCEGIVWVVTSQLTQVNPQNHIWLDDRMHMCGVYCKYVYLIICVLKDHLGKPRDNVCEVSLCLT